MQVNVLHVCGQCIYMLSRLISRTISKYSTSSMLHVCVFFVCDHVCGWSLRCARARVYIHTIWSISRCISRRHVLCVALVCVWYHACECITCVCMSMIKYIHVCVRVWSNIFVLSWLISRAISRYGTRTALHVCVLCVCAIMHVNALCVAGMYIVCVCCHVCVCGVFRTR